VLPGGDRQAPYYVRYYSLSLSSASQVTIDLESTAFNPFLLLWTAKGSHVAHGNSGIGDSTRVAADLPAGQYIIGVTSSEPNGLGAFDLYSYAIPTHYQNCEIRGTHAIGSTVSTRLDASTCLLSLPGWSHDPWSGDVWFLRLNRERRVRISMVSDSVDTFLFLLDLSRNVVVDSDGHSHRIVPQINARLSDTYPAGNYLIVAASWRPGWEGPYTLTSTIW
jgi:hypothetical protein